MLGDIFHSSFSLNCSDHSLNNCFGVVIHPDGLLIFLLVRMCKVVSYDLTS